MNIFYTSDFSSNPRLLDIAIQQYYRQEAGKDNREIIDLVFKNMDDSYVLLLRLKYSGFKHKEIAEMLDIPIGTVSLRIRIAKNNFINLFEQIRENNRI